MSVNASAPLNIERISLAVRFFYYRHVCIGNMTGEVWYTVCYSMLAIYRVFRQQLVAMSYRGVLIYIVLRPSVLPALPSKHH